MKYIMYIRMAVAIIKLLQALFAKQATAETREGAITTALKTTKAVLPNVERHIEKISTDDIGDIAYLAEQLAAWEPGNEN